MLRARFAGVRDLLLLEIDLERISADVRWENLEGGSEPFPHIYGPLPLAAVISVQALST